MGELILVLVFIVAIIVAVVIHLDADAQQDQGKAEDADAQVKEHAVPEDGRQFNASDRDEHARCIGGGGRRAGDLTAGLAVVVGAQRLGGAGGRIHPHDGHGVGQGSIHRRFKGNRAVGRHYQRAAGGASAYHPPDEGDVCRIGIADLPA